MMSRPSVIRSFAALLLVAATLLPGAGWGQSLADIAKQVKTTHIGLFGKPEMRAGAVDAVLKWKSVLDKMKAQKEQLKRCAVDAASCDPATKAWHKIMGDVAGLDRMAQLKAVTIFFNKWPYKTDLENYHVVEYWATPVDFLIRSGMCHDYAITKFYALLELGFSNDDMRIVALTDQIRGIGHAVLAVHMGNDFVILDNLSDLVMSHTRYPQYDPQFSVNETTRWMHVASLMAK